MLLVGQARENLELSFTAEAEMVFTTLSSTGRRIFSRLPAPFETVLVDEAAQASEIAALQALAFGCRRRAPPGRWRMRTHLMYLQHTWLLQVHHHDRAVLHGMPS